LHRAAMAQTMAQLGVRGQILADGRVRLADGRTVGRAIYAEPTLGEATKSAAGENDGTGTEGAKGLVEMAIPIVGDVGGTTGDLVAPGGCRIGGAAGFFPIDYSGGGGASHGVLSPSLIDARVAPLKHQIKTLRGQNVKLRHSLQRAGHETRRVEKMYSERLEKLREENRATKTQLKDATIGFENKSAQLMEQFKEQLRALAKNRSRFEKNTEKIKVLVLDEPKRMASRRNVTSPANAGASDSNDDISLLRARLEKTRIRAEDAERKVLLAAKRQPKQRDATRAFVDGLKYRDELVRMGSLAEQLVIALHRGCTETTTAQTDDESPASASNDAVSDARGPLPEGISGVEAAAAAAAFMGDPRHFPRYHALRLPKDPAVSGRREDEVVSSFATKNEAEGALAIRRRSSASGSSSSSSSNHTDTVRDLARKRTTESRLRDANQRYRSLRCAHDALLRRTQKASLSPKQSSRVPRKIRAHSAEKRRVLLVDAGRRPETGADNGGRRQWRQRPRTAHC